MSEPMKAQSMEEFAELSFHVPAAYADKIRQLVRGILALLEKDGRDTEEERFYPVEDIFPEGIKPAEVLRGARSGKD